ncbi:hypothetical protein [Micromonospora yangpuensis]|nr:hypothetical protein [Micromonospora yangpuensis]
MLRQLFQAEAAHRRQFGGELRGEQVGGLVRSGAYCMAATAMKPTNAAEE